MAENILSMPDDQSPLFREIKINSEGKGFVSFRGVARICGMQYQSFTQKGGSIFGAKLTEKLAAAGFEVTVFSEWKKSGIPDTAVAVIVEHYAFDAGERCTKEALLAFRAFGAFGIRTWIQRELGWKPPSEVSLFIEKHILREARTWEVVFDRPWIRAAEQCTGWKWSDQCMSKVINLIVYNRLPVEVRQRLDQLNPVLDGGHRARKQHQFFSDESVEQVLKMQIEIARSLLLVSTSWPELKENSRRRFEGMAQLKLLS